MSDVQHFILVFDRQEDQLVEQLSFGTKNAEAVRRYQELEEVYRDSPHMDILLVGSDSIETVRATHPNYFGFRIPERFAGVLSIANA